MKSQTKELSLAWQTCLVVMMGVAAVMLPQWAFASSVSSPSPMSNALCIGAAWIMGNTGRGIATIGITIVGFGALLGKISWGMAMIVGVGVAIIFGATSLISLLGGTPAANFPGSTVTTTNCT